MEVLEKETLGTIKGGNDEYITYEFGINGYGQRFMREYGSSEWIPLLDVVQIPYADTSGGGGFDYSNIVFVPGTNPFNLGPGDGYNPGGGGTGSGNSGVSIIDVTRVNVVGGYLETLTISNHLDAYNFLDGMQSGLSDVSLLASLLSLSTITAAAATMLGFVIASQDAAWGSIEANYMNTGNSQGIKIEKIVMSGQHMQTPNVTYIIKDSNGNQLGTVTGQGW